MLNTKGNRITYFATARFADDTFGQVALIDLG